MSQQVFFTISPHFMGGFTCDLLIDGKVQDGGGADSPDLIRERIRAKYPDAVQLTSDEFHAKLVQIRREKATNG